MTFSPKPGPDVALEFRPESCAEGGRYLRESVSTPIRGNLLTSKVRNYSL
jgi:hypothetical protein